MNIQRSKIIKFTSRISHDVNKSVKKMHTYNIQVKKNNKMTHSIVKVLFMTHTSGKKLISLRVLREV